ncbi:hypothetical protein N5E30_14640 [Pseudomonas chengduensis]|nr:MULTISPECIES: hypothetical protein [Pseudomonas]MDH0623691.1 hypothetical protein [Pseudomonas chengduensis]MDH1280575.1 hypothetical protein [Pseudomonas chengduensis]MDH1668009.1 hypothetical protein [Pseudomonas chengduensis]MDH1682811.1 hypothetical protein [Pseudomonas chengduensis]
MKTLIALTATLILSAPVLADNGQASQNGKGLHPEWLISHEG